MPEHIKKADAVLLGCTHFSALKSSFSQVLAPEAHIIDAGELVAREVLLELEANGGLSLAPKTPINAFVSDNCERFLRVAGRFIDEPLNVTLAQNEFLA